MPEELNPNAAIETPPTTEPEPEGVVEVQGQKLAPVSAIVAERERVRNTERERAAKEREAVEQQRQAAEQRAAQLQAQLESLQALHAPKPPDIPDVSDEEAERYARRYELFTPQGLDITRAKQIIADNRKETEQIARKVAQEAVQGPRQDLYLQQSRQNFFWAANQRDPHGQPLVDPRALAEKWASLPAELTAKPEVAQHLLTTVAGEMLMMGKRPPAAPASEPTFTEAPGGNRQPAYQMDALAKRLAKVSGMTDKDFTERAKTYVPGATNFLE